MLICEDLGLLLVDCDDMVDILVFLNGVVVVWGDGCVMFGFLGGFMLGIGI